MEVLAEINERISIICGGRGIHPISSADGRKSCCSAMIMVPVVKIEEDDPNVVYGTRGGRAMY